MIALERNTRRHKKQHQKHRVFSHVRDDLKTFLLEQLFTSSLDHTAKYMPRIIKQKVEDASELAAMASVFQEREESLEFGILLNCSKDLCYNIWAEDQTIAN